METSYKNKYPYPYIPEGREVFYVPIDNYYMAQAKKIAHEKSSDKMMPTGCVIVGSSGGLIVGFGANYSPYHEANGCERKKQNMPTGVGYDLCEGCQPHNHAEISAVKSAGDLASGSDLYLWGHWWCCKDCWASIIEAGIRNVYLLEKSDILFNREDADNIVGHQFDV